MPFPILGGVSFLIYILLFPRPTNLEMLSTSIKAYYLSKLDFEIFKKFELLSTAVVAVCSKKFGIVLEVQKLSRKHPSSGPVLINLQTYYMKFLFSILYLLLIVVMGQRNVRGCNVEVLES